MVNERRYRAFIDMSENDGYAEAVRMRCRVSSVHVVLVPGWGELAEVLVPHVLNHRPSALKLITITDDNNDRTSRLRF